ncbi:MAG: hypothetical protein KI791_02255 [Cyclobacteriaceae bacterium]|nr:hypothetical protein [Cyclobacteriaceae bacterium SS2]
MKLTSFYSSCVILSIFFLMGCGGSGKGSKADAVEFSASKEKLVADIDKVLADLPNPSEVPYTLQAAAADYNEDLINGLSKSASYQNDEDKAALNLGVYATDMGYLISYEQVQKSLDYLEACQKLSETIGVSSIFNNQMITKFQESEGNKDTLSSMIDKAIDQAGRNLNEAERLNVGALILTGSFVEGLYLAVKVIETYPTDVLDEDNRNLILEPLVKIVLDQEKPLMDVIALLEDIPHDETILEMMEELKILKLLYDGDLAEVEKKIAENTGDFILTQDMLLDITIEVKRIRSEIVG